MNSETLVYIGHVKEAGMDGLCNNDGFVGEERRVDGVEDWVGWGAALWHTELGTEALTDGC